MSLQEQQEPPQPAPTFTQNPEELIKDAKKLVSHMQEIHDHLVKSVKPSLATFANVLLPLAQLENTVSTQTDILSFYREVSSNSRLREASSEAGALLSTFHVQVGTREELFELVDAVMAREEKLDLDIESRRFLQHMHRRFIRGGVRVPPGPQRTRFREIQQRLSEFRGQFRQNLKQINVCQWFSKEELHGVPDDLLGRLDTRQEKFKVSQSDPVSASVLASASDSEVRRRLYMDSQNKCNTNEPLLKEAVELRFESARLLGYANHATLKLEEKMAKTPETVNGFLEDLARRLSSGAGEMVSRLKKVKELDLQSRGQDFDGYFFLWDYDYYKRLILEREYAVDGEKIAEYFPLETTLDGVMDIARKLFGLEFVPSGHRDGNKTVRNVWHEDVEMFSVWNDEAHGGQFVGYLYLDLYRRENKYGTPASFNLQPGFLRPDGTRHYPSTALLSCFSKPTAEKPSLLKHFDVVLLLHEFGHAIHDLVSQTRYARFHGTRGPVDFAEAPSQLLENWCWTESHLRDLSCHYSYLSASASQVGKAGTDNGDSVPRHIPTEMINGLLKTRNMGYGPIFYLAQVHLAMFDMKVHQAPSMEEVKAIDLAVEYDDLRRRLRPFDGPEVLDSNSHDWGHWYASWGHLMGEYDAGYYAYLFSEVCAADMFQSFSTPFGTIDMSEGRRYRETVLEPGASRDEMEILVNFLGRKPSPEAFYRKLGIE